MIKNKKDLKNIIDKIENNQKIQEQKHKEKIWEKGEAENITENYNPGDIEYNFGESEIGGYDIKQKEFYQIANNHSKNQKRIHIFSIPIEFNGLVIDDNGNTYIDATIDGKKHFYSFDEAKDEIKNHAVTGSHLEKIAEFLTFYINDPNNKKIRIHPDIIYIDNDIIKVENPYTTDLKLTLNTIYKMYLSSTNQDNFIINFAYYLISPLSYFFRKQNKLFPYLINAGPHQTGKTSYMILFGNIGYGQDLLKSHFTRNDIKTFYTLMRSRSESILPITLEDVDIDWIRFQSTMLKGSAGTINGGSRGYFNRVLKYESKSQITFDTNDFVDVETAQLDRFFICNFKISDASRVNIAEFDKLKDELNPGFMFEIFNAIFGGKKLSELTKELYNVKDRESLKINIIKYIIKKINLLMPNNMQFKLPDFSILTNDSNEIDWYAEIYSTGKYAYNQFKADSKVHIYELNESQIDFDNCSLFITPGGYSLLQRHLNIPYASITKLYNGTESKNFEAHFTSHRFDNEHPLKCLLITPKLDKDNNDKKNKNKTELQKLLKLKEEAENLGISTDFIEQKIDELSQKESQNKNPDPPKDPPDNDDRNPENSALDHDNKGHNNFDINLLPEGPVKQSLKEEQEQKALEKHQETKNDNKKDPGNSENKDSEKAKEGNEGNNENNKGNPENIIMPKGKAHYYQVLKNFNKYDYSFFYGSDISFNSSKIIPKKGSSETSYILLKLLIPDKLNKTPKGWGLFLADSQEISETDFNILSRGDSQ